MAGTTAEINLASNALLLLGHQPIASFTEPTAGAEVAGNLFRDSYRSLLTLHRWRFASKQARLARLSASPERDYQYQFQIPTDALYVIRVIDVRDYEIYGDRVYANDSDIYIEYIYEVEADRVPSYFSKMAEYYLAAQFAIPITGDIDKAQLFEGKYEKALIRAKFLDSSQRPSVAVASNPYAEVRR